jgi:DNA polymerase-3 subunit gamma/tau
LGNKKLRFTGSKSQDFLLKGITIANDCDLKFKLSQNQRLLVELCLMPLSLLMEKKKIDAFIIPQLRKNDYSIADKTKATEQIAVTVIPRKHSSS